MVVPCVTWKQPAPKPQAAHGSSLRDMKTAGTKTASLRIRRENFDQCSDSSCHVHVIFQFAVPSDSNRSNNSWLPAGASYFSIVHQYNQPGLLISSVTLAFGWDTPERRGSGEEHYLRVAPLRSEPHLMKSLGTSSPGVFASTRVAI